MDGRICLKSALQNKVWLILALSSIMMSGCADMARSSDTEDENTIIRTYVCSFSPATKTTLSSEGSVSWSAGDQVTYYSKDCGQLHTFTVEQDAVSATMTLSLAANATYLTAISGISSVSDYTKDALTVSNVVKAEQDGLFASGHTAIARTTQVNVPTLTFYNIVSFVTFATSRTDIAYVIFSSNDETALHANGTINVHYKDGFPTASFGSNPGNCIKISLNGAGLYYIATLPNTLQNGFSISCYDANDNLIGTATGINALTIKRSTIARLGIIDNRLVAPNGIKIDGYGPDINWDGIQNSGADLFNNKYGEDYNWDTTGNSNGNLNKSGYKGDTNWDSNSNGNANVGKSGYNGDSNWDSNTNAGGNVGVNGYGNDTNWN